MPPPQPRLRILAFGASITAGWHTASWRNHPYALRLRTHLQSLLPTTKITIDVDGFPGDTVIGGRYERRMRARFPLPSPPPQPQSHPASSSSSEAAVATKPAEQQEQQQQEEEEEEQEEGEETPYDWVIVQAGGNDILASHPPAEIFERLREIWGIGMRGGAKVLALTVTETGVKEEKWRGRYEVFNGLVREAAAAEKGEGGVWVADVCREMPFEGGREEWWDDGLHFTPEGYDRFGEVVGEVLAGIILGGEGAKV